MKRIYSLLLLLFISSLSLPSAASAFWVWTPETNKWINPKYSVKETPAEQLQVGVDFYEAGQYKESIQEFKKLIKHYSRSRQAPDAQYYIGLCLEEQGNIYASFKAYQLVIDKYPFSEHSAQIVKKQYDLGVELLDGQKGKSKFKQALLGDEYGVVDIFKTVIKNAPYGELASQAQYKIGLYLLEKKLYQEARDEFEKVLNDYPDSQWTKAAKYQIAMTDAQRSTRAQYDQKVTQSAVAEFEDFLEIFPDAELSEDAKLQIYELREKEAENNFLIAKFYEKQKNYKAAKTYYQTIVNDYAKTRWAAPSLKKILKMNQKEE